MPTKIISRDIPQKFHVVGKFLLAAKTMKKVLAVRALRDELKNITEAREQLEKPLIEKIQKALEDGKKPFGNGSFAYLREALKGTDAEQAVTDLEELGKETISVVYTIEMTEAEIDAALASDKITGEDIEVLGDLLVVAQHEKAV